MARAKWPSRRSQRIDFVMDEETLKGFRNEDLMEEALQILRAAGHIYHYLRAERGGELDNHGIDFLIWPEFNWTVPLQAKSSARGRMEHLSEHGELIPFCVVIEPFDTVPDLAEKILLELGLSVRSLEEVVALVLREDFAVKAMTGS